jgi:hypothetical protein
MLTCKLKALLGHLYVAYKQIESKQRVSLSQKQDDAKFSVKILQTQLQDARYYAVLQLRAIYGVLTYAQLLGMYYTLEYV